MTRILDAASDVLFSAEYERAQLDRRRSPCRPVSLDARIGRGGLDRALCRVTNISQHGARLDTYSALRRDSVIWLTLPRIGMIAATIRWADDFAAGCEFAEPLSSSQLDALIVH